MQMGNRLLAKVILAMLTAPSSAQISQEHVAENGG